MFFQLTTSRGGRRNLRAVVPDGIFFNSRPLVEVALPNFYLAEKKVLFNSRPLVEVDNIRTASISSWHFFNSRPLVEVDCAYLTFFCKRNFSTHDLSWRSTAKLHNKPLKFCIFSGHFILEQMSLPFSYKYH